MNLHIIHSKIFEIRKQKVMLDFDLAELYEVETRILNQSVKRNIEKFPEDFMFRTSINEWEIIWSQIVTGSDISNSSQIVMSSNKNRGKTYTPYAFTEHGVTMLASVLRSKRAIDMNIAIVRTFTAMRYFANSNKELFEQIIELRKEMQTSIGEHDTQLAAIYDTLENLLDKKEEEKENIEKWLKREQIGFKKNPDQPIN